MKGRRKEEVREIINYFKQTAAYKLIPKEIKTRNHEIIVTAD